MLKMATGFLSLTATCSPMLSASAVFPMLGRPAMMIRSPSWNPDVSSSSRVKPVDTPVTSLGLLAAVQEVDPLHHLRQQLVDVAEADTPADARFGDLEHPRFGLVEQLPHVLAERVQRAVGDLGADRPRASASPPARGRSRRSAGCCAPRACSGRACRGTRARRSCPCPRSTRSTPRPSRRRPASPVRSAARCDGRCADGRRDRNPRPTAGRRCDPRRRCRGAGRRAPTAPPRSSAAEPSG